jgi:hypothetical protein
LDVIKLKFHFRQNNKIKVASLVAYLATMFVPRRHNDIDAEIQKTEHTGVPELAPQRKKGSLRANILTCILKKKSPISNDNREKTF